MWHRRRDPRIADEIRFHRDRLIEEYVAGGMNRRHAERRAFLEFGNAMAIEESVRDVRGRWLNDLAKDLIYAWRTLRRSRSSVARTFYIFQQTEQRLVLRAVAFG